MKPLVQMAVLQAVCAATSVLALFIAPGQQCMLTHKQDLYGNCYVRQRGRQYMMPCLGIRSAITPP